jgi:hypothetical protein
MIKATTIKTFPFHVFLLPTFFILHVLNDYYGLIPAKPYFTFGLYYFSLSALLLLAGKWLLGSLNKSGIWATSLLIMFYFFGATHDWLKKLSLPPQFTSYSTVLIIIAITAILYTVYLRRSQKTFPKIHHYLNLLFTILVLIEIVFAVVKVAGNKQAANNYAYNQPPLINKLPPSDSMDPDIFFIVFDEYTSSLALKKYLQYDNTPLDAALRANNFYIATNSKSNYNSTPLSIGSSFNMQYFDKDFQQEKTTTKSILQALYSLKKSQLPTLLSGKGYEVYNFGLCDLNNYPVNTYRTFSEYESRPLYRETLWGRIEKDIWWHLSKLNIPVLNTLHKKKEIREATQVVTGNDKNFRLTLAALNNQTTRPKFVFTHIMMPHAPFILDGEGRIQIPFPDSYDKEAYLRQLAYCNKWIDSLAQAANQPFARSRVVIIEGDHGFRDSNQSAIREKQFMNLNAYYFSDKDYGLLYDSISPVNTFKVISNKYFRTTLPLSKDSTILLY